MCMVGKVLVGGGRKVGKLGVLPRCPMCMVGQVLRVADMTYSAYIPYMSPI